MAKEHPIFLGGRWEKSDAPMEVITPYNGEAIGVTYRPTEEQVEKATQIAVNTFETTRKRPAYERASILQRILDGVAKRKEEFVKTIVLEAGKPWKDASGEVDRSLHNLETAVEESKRLEGHILPLDLREHSKNRIGFLRRYPLGPIAAITPFNFPLNLPLHKLGPAIAAGNTIVLKPASKTPLTMLLLAEVMAEADMPEGIVSILPMSSSLAQQKLVEDDRYKLLTFTGSAEIGWDLKARCGKKKITLELGGNAGVIVDKDANTDFAIRRIAAGGFSYAGQSCISVQRVYVHREIFEEFTQELVGAVRNLKMGDPMDPTTDVGPMIDEGAAQQTEEWIQEGIREGASVLTGGKAKGSFFEPTVLTDVNPRSKVCSMEVFAPVINLLPFADFKEAVAEVNNSAYGLQAGVFTENLENAFYAFDELQVGGVVVNDASNYRIDSMPYGGVKDSGMGREGVRYAIEEMTEPKLMVLNRF